MISQREARRFKKRVKVLEDQINRQRRAWGAEYIGGTHLTSAKWEQNAEIPVAIRTARKLSHAVVCTADDSGVVRFFALPLAEIN